MNHLTRDQIAAAIVARRAIEVREEARRRKVVAAVETNSAIRGTLPQLSGEAQNTGQTEEKASKPKGDTRDLLAQEAGVSSYLIQKAMKIQEKNPELLMEVAHGNITAAVRP